MRSRSGEQGAGVVVFGNDVAVEVVDAVQRDGACGALDAARQGVIDVSAGGGAVDAGRGELAGGVVDVVFCRGRRDEIVVRDVAGGIRLEGAREDAAGGDALPAGNERARTQTP